MKPPDSFETPDEFQAREQHFEIDARASADDDPQKYIEVDVDQMPDALADFLRWLYGLVDSKGKEAPLVFRVLKKEYHPPASQGAADLPHQHDRPGDDR